MIPGSGLLSSVLSFFISSIPPPIGHRSMLRLFVATVLLSTGGGGLVVSGVASSDVDAPHSSSIHVIDLKGVSGKRFSGDRVRKSSVPLSFQNLRRSDLKQLNEQQHLHCRKWIVVTSIFQPSDAVRKLGEMTKKNWCFVVVADVNGPKDYDDVENVIYLTVEQQKRLHYHIIDLLPWRHFGRKNIGFLYAIEHGAEVIYDTDDDNRLKVLDIPIWGPAEAEETTSSQSSQNSQLLGLSQYVEMKTYEGGDKWGSGSGVEYSARTHGSEVLPIVPRETVVNTYLDFKPSCGRRIWPRGFPLDNINDEHHPPLVPMNTTSAVFNFKPPAVQQFLADEDPDVDAIYRLTGKLPCVFEEKQHAITVPKGKFVPYNAQCVVNLKPAFWTLLLPVTVNGRVSDIWRSYIAQKLLWDIDEHVAFMPAHVIHDRVFHDYLKDFQSESDLYLKSTALVKFLAGWVSDAPTLVERIEQLYEQLYERGFVEEKDLKLSQAWIRDLLALGYKFPDLVIPKILPRGYGGTGSSARQEEL